MKKLISLLFSLWCNLAMGQTDNKTVVIAPAPGKPGSAYTVSLYRDWAQYPATSSGLNAWKAAIAAGSFKLTSTSNGCIIPAGTRPTAYAPTCGVATTPISYSNVVILGNSITKYGSGYGYDASSADWDYVHILTSRLKTLNSLVQVRTQDQFPNGNIADVGYWEANHGHTDGGLTRFAGIAAQRLDGLYVSLGENINETTNLREDLIALVTYLTTNSPGCKTIIRCSIWAKDGVDNIIQTTAAEKGWIFVNGRGIAGAMAGRDNHPNDAAMLTIADRFWAATPKSTTPVTPPTTSAYYSNGFGEGTVAQLMQSAPFMPSTNQIDSWSYASQPIQYLDNGTVRFGIGRSIGGAIQHIGLSNGGKNWVNTYKESASTFEGLKAPDTGRSGGWSLYGTPGHFYMESGQNTGDITIGDDTGWNPVHGGSRFQNRSLITWYERRTVPGYGEVLYCRTRPYQWSMNGILAKVELHCYWWLEGNNTRYFTIIDNFRDDNQRIYHGYQQEGPFIYTTGDLWHHKLYNGASPGTGGSLTDISRTTPGLDSQIPVGTEPWIASLNDQDNGVVLLSQHNPRMMGGQFNEFGGDEFSLAASYINSAQMINMDVNVATAFGGYIWAGSLSGFRSWYNANQSQIQFRPFSFNFTPGITCGWWTADTEAKFNSENRYEFLFGNEQGAGGNFNPPYGIYKASDIPTIYIKGKFTNISQIDIRWNRNDQNDNQSNAAEQVTTLNVIGDGQERTYSVNMAGKAGWSGYIGSMRFGPKLGNPATTSQKFVPTYIGKNQPN